MSKAAGKLVGKKDFSVFAKDAASYKTCRRDVKMIKITKKKKFIYIDIEADGFLRNMVRNVVTFLVKVAKNEIKLESTVAIISGKKPYVNKPAPAGGLYLTKVKY